MLLYTYKTGGVTASLLKYPAGQAFMLEDDEGKKIILKMDDDGFSKFAKLIAFGDSVSIHGFAVTLTDGNLAIEGNVIGADGVKTKGKMGLHIPSHELGVLTPLLVDMVGDGHVLWSTYVTGKRLRLVVSHKRGLEWNVLDDGVEGNSFRMLYAPVMLIEAIGVMTNQVNGDFYQSRFACDLENPWTNTRFVVNRDNEVVTITASGQMLKGTEVTYTTNVTSLRLLLRHLNAYFFGI